MNDRNDHCPGASLSASSFTRDSVEVYLSATLAERDRLARRLETARRRCTEAEELLRRLDALAGGAAGPHRRAGEKVGTDG